MGKYQEYFVNFEDQLTLDFKRLDAFHAEITKDPDISCELCTLVILLTLTHLKLSDSLSVQRSSFSPTNKELKEFIRITLKLGDDEWLWPACAERPLAELLKHRKPPEYVVKLDRHQALKSLKRTFGEGVDSDSFRNVRRTGPTDVKALLKRLGI